MIWIQGKQLAETPPAGDHDFPQQQLIGFWGFEGFSPNFSSIKNGSLISVIVCQMPINQHPFQFSTSSTSSTSSTLQVSETIPLTPHNRSTSFNKFKMKSITAIASILGLALAATAAPTLQARWCTPVCCCGGVCTVDEVCEAGLDNSVTYCCNENLETVSSSTDYSKVAIPAADLLSRPHLNRLRFFIGMVLALLNRLGLSEIGPKTIWLWAMFMRLQ
jgi:hypothetical protein